jgi:carboxymethylenebutenolidase
MFLLREDVSMQPFFSVDDRLQVIETSGADGTPLTVSQPSRTARAGIVLLHEIWGMTDEIATLTVRLANCGFIAVAPHLYHRFGSPVVTDRAFNKARRYHNRLSADGLSADLESAVVWARTRGAHKVALVGFSMGGTIALWAAALSLRIDAAVTFYGSGLASPRWPGVLSGIDAARALKVPWLGIYGERDASTPPEDLLLLRETLALSATRSTLIVYPSVGHGLALDPRVRRHVPTEAEEALEQARLFLELHLS